MSTKPTFNTTTVLELACVAFRVNDWQYIKQTQAMISADDKVLGYVHSNKNLIRYALGVHTWGNTTPLPDLTILDEDKEFASEIFQFYKRLAFGVMANSASDFQKETFVCLNSPDTAASKIGYIACLPQTMLRDKEELTLTKKINSCSGELIGTAGDTLIDKDCEIIETKWSEKFGCWNNLAIVDNCLVSWMSKNCPSYGPGVLLKAKVKDHRVHWKYAVPETRLNYVKVFQ